MRSGRGNSVNRGCKKAHSRVGSDCKWPPPHWMLGAACYQDSLGQIMEGFIARRKGLLCSGGDRLGPFPIVGGRGGGQASTKGFKLVAPGVARHPVFPEGRKRPSKDA